jgi:hypothetical protein
MKRINVNNGLKMMVACCVLVPLAFQGEAMAGQITLSPSNAIGGTPVYNSLNVASPAPFNQGVEAAGDIFDNQTGPVSEPTHTGFWLNPDANDGGSNQPYILVNLGGPYQLSSIELFNTHNSTSNNRGTSHFEILGGNAVATSGGNGYVLSGPSTMLVNCSANCALSSVVGDDPIPGQSFTPTDVVNDYQYLEFIGISVVAGAKTSTSFGLNEMRVFGTAAPVPELPAPLMLGTGVLVPWIARRRRALSISV